MARRDDEWVPLRRYDNTLDAEIAQNFLREHDLEARLHGNVGTTSSLGHLVSGFSVQLMVRESERELATEALTALASAEPEAHREEDELPSGPAYRGEARGYERPAGVRHRYKRAVPLLAIVFPLGAGHFYARHTVAGVVYGASVLACGIGGAVLEKPWPGAAALLIVLSDVAFGMQAVDRFNEGRVPSGAKQGAVAALTVALSVVTALLTAGNRVPTPRAANGVAPHGHSRAGGR